MRRRLLVIELLVLLLAIGIGGGLWLAARDPGVRITTRDGRLTFTAPTGWQRYDCPSAAADCVIVRPQGENDGDGEASVSAAVGAANPVEGNPAAILLDPALSDAELGGARRFRLDGVPAVRMESAEEAAIVVYAVLVETGDELYVSCTFGRREEAVRVACERVIATLTVKRG